MPLRLRRVRGALLRIVRRPGLSITIGLLLAAPAGWAQFSDGAAAWWVQGIALVALATGIALIWTGLTGERPDWVE
jgi:hypothetical protein